MDKTKEFSRKLCLLLEQKGMLRNELADKLDVDASLVSKYSTGRRLPTLQHIQKMGEIFGVSTDYLLSLDESTISKPIDKMIPVLGEVHAGQPSIVMDENIVGYEKVSEELTIKGELFALKVKGDSMSPRFMEGDIVIVKRQPYANTGDIVVSFINGNEATIKQFKQNPNGIVLIPFNSKYNTLLFTNDEILSKPVQILGVVVELRARKFN